MNSSSLINSFERCPYMARLAQRIEKESLSFHQLLKRGVEFGVQSDDDDPAKAASDEVMRLCWTRPIDTDKEDLLGLAEHTAALVEIIVYCLRTGAKWEHPIPIKVGNELWSPSCWLIPGGLRRIVLCDRWDERRALQEMRDWQTLEGALYGLPVTIIAIVLGAARDGRRHGPLAKGWLHPRSKELRFRKRDGGGFEGNWEPVWRERYDGSRDDWVEAMNGDDVMTDTFVIHPVEEFGQEDREAICKLAAEKLQALHEPDREGIRNLSRCFDSIRPCEFRFPCAYFKEPEEGKGFVKRRE